MLLDALTSLQYSYILPKNAFIKLYCNKLQQLMSININSNFNINPQLISF